MGNSRAWRKSRPPSAQPNVVYSNLNHEPAGGRLAALKRLYVDGCSPRFQVVGLVDLGSPSGSNYIGLIFGRQRPIVSNSIPRILYREVQHRTVYPAIQRIPHQCLVKGQFPVAKRAFTSTQSVSAEPSAYKLPYYAVELILLVPRRGEGCRNSIGDLVSCRGQFLHLDVMLSSVVYNIAQDDSMDSPDGLVAAVLEKYSPVLDKNG